METQLRMDKAELDHNPAEKQLVTANALIAKLENKRRKMKESNRIQKLKSYYSRV